MSIDKTLENELNINVPSQDYFNNFATVDKQRQYFVDLFKDVNGYQVSYEEKKKLDLFENKTFTYSEVDFDGFKAILDIVNPPNDYVFFDCGSGLGKALLLSSLLTPCKKLIGREKLPSLVEENKAIFVKYMDYLKRDYSNVLIPELDLKEESFINYSFKDVDVLFAHSTCFDNELMNSLTDKLLELKKGSSVITVTKQIDHPDFECIHKGFYKMNWGSPTVFIYKKI